MKRTINFHFSLLGIEWAWNFFFDRFFFLIEILSPLNGMRRDLFLFIYFFLKLEDWVDRGMLILCFFWKRSLWDVLAAFASISWNVVFSSIRTIFARCSEIFQTSFQDIYRLQKRMYAWGVDFNFLTMMKLKFLWKSENKTFSFK